MQDTTNPTVIAQNLTVQLDASGSASILASQVDNGSGDNCTVANLSLDTSDFTCDDLGANTVTLTVTDQSGNSASETALVTIVDVIDPVVDCPNGFNIDSNGDYTLPDYITEGIVTVSDNCDFIVVQNPAPGTVLPDGNYLISFDVSDASGNTAACSFSLEVENPTLSVNDSDHLDSAIGLYPNPVRDSFTLQNSKNLNLMNAKIIDLKGGVIQSDDLRSMGTRKKISMQNFQSGIYFVRIESETSVTVKRIVKL